MPEPIAYFYCQACGADVYFQDAATMACACRTHPWTYIPWPDPWIITDIPWSADTNTTPGPPG